MEIGRGRCKNDILLMMSEDFKDKGCDWVRESCGVVLKIKQENTCESTVPVMIEKAWKREKKQNPTCLMN